MNMNRLLAPVIALVLGFASISAFAVDTPRDGATVTKKQHHRAAKKHHGGKRVQMHHRAPAVR